MIRKTINPEGWPRPRGYANGVLAQGSQLYIAGQIGWDENERFPGPDFLPQAEQALRNIVSVLEAAGGSPEHLVRMTWYVTDKQAYIANLSEIGGMYREIIGKHYPAMTAIEVSSLMEDEAVIEIEATAVLPET
jgi:enamine deaminase RidA (YjgF/YER057c/UK114 family)